MALRMFERVRRCKYCKSDMTDTVSATSCAQNPFCNGCLHERVTKTAEAAGPRKIVREGHYFKWIPAEEPTTT